jgi:hypothetical protein
VGRFPLRKSMLEALHRRQLQNQQSWPTWLVINSWNRYLCRANFVELALATAWDHHQPIEASAALCAAPTLSRHGLQPAFRLRPALTTPVPAGAPLVGGGATTPHNIILTAETSPNSLCWHVMTQPSSLLWHSPKHLKPTASFPHDGPPYAMTASCV